MSPEAWTLAGGIIAAVIGVVGVIVAAIIRSDVTGRIDPQHNGFTVQAGVTDLKRDISDLRNELRREIRSMRDAHQAHLQYHHIVQRDM